MVPLLLGVKMIVPLVGVDCDHDVAGASVRLVIDVAKLQVVENGSLKKMKMGWWCQSDVVRFTEHDVRTKSWDRHLTSWRKGRATISL